jgi:CO dehydrogenase/acetyl-CoA synthase epsilon subunit
MNLLWFMEMKQVLGGYSFTARSAKVTLGSLGNSKHDPVLFLPIALFYVEKQASQLKFAIDFPFVTFFP